MMQDYLNRNGTFYKGDKIKHVRIMLVKAKSADHYDSCEGCIFYNEEEKMDCSLIGSSMSCVIDLNFNYVWKTVTEINEKETK